MQKFYISRRRSKANRQILKRKLINMMGGCCVDCGYSANMAALDFDHRESEQKSFNLASGLSSKTDLECEVEASKCEIRCANCHRIKTHPEYAHV